MFYRNMSDILCVFFIEVKTKSIYSQASNIVSWKFLGCSHRQKEDDNNIAWLTCVQYDKSIRKPTIIRLLSEHII